MILYDISVHAGTDFCCFRICIYLKIHTITIKGFPGRSLPHETHLIVLNYVLVVF